MRLSTKKDFSDLMLSVLNPLKGKYSEKGALLNIGSHMACYGDKTAKFEGFARVLWGLVPFWCGGGSDQEFEEIYLKGIISGTDPECDEFWGKCHNFDQRFVEMASLSYALLLTPEKIWTPLTKEEKEKFAAWLYQINDLYVPESNWLFFRVLVNIALKKVGMHYSEEKLCEDLEYIDSLYLGDGWYADGFASERIPHNGQRDYYNPFAIHFYSLLYAKVIHDARAEKFKARAIEFAKSFIYWFSDEGAAVPYGRSLTYRFAQIAFWSACLLSDTMPFEIGVIKGIIVRNLMYWFEDSTIFDNGHILTVGYKYSQPAMSEAYNSCTSPYWCMKAFAFLALPDEHGFWSAEPMPLPKLNKLCVQEKADIIAARYGGDSVLYPAGTLSAFSGNTMHKYLKFAYSSKFGFSVPKSDWGFSEAAADSTLSFEIGGRIYTRVKNYGHEIKNESLVIFWSPVDGIDVKTEIIPTENGHIRNHIVKAGFDCIAYDSGFAVSALDGDNMLICESEGSIAAKNNFSSCSVCSDEGERRVFYAAPNTNLLSPKTVIPVAVYKIKKGVNKFTTKIEVL